MNWRHQRRNNRNGGGQRGSMAGKRKISGVGGNNAYKDGAF